MGALEALTTFRSQSYEADGLRIELRELSADDAATIWADLETAESGGKMIDAYRFLVLYGAYEDGERIFESVDQVNAIPSRHLVPMGEAMLALCDMGLDSGKEDGPAESYTELP